MEFGNLKDLWYLVVPGVVFLIILLGIIKKNNIVKRFGFFISRRSEVVKLIFFTLGMALLVLALLSPQKEKNNSVQQITGTDIYVLFDVSNSMLAEDIYPNRLEQSKKILESILDGLSGDRIGFIPFSDSAYIQMPLTDDYSMAKNYLQAIDTNLISGGGTELLTAMKLADKSFTEAETTNKTVLIISDGGDEKNDVREFVKSSGIVVFSIGVGTQEGGVIPKIQNGNKVGFIKDRLGNIVTTKLNSGFLQEISQGGYYEINNISNNSDKFIQDIKQIKKDKIREKKMDIYEKYYQIPLLLGFLLILIASKIRGEIRGER